MRKLIDLDKNIIEDIKILAKKEKRPVKNYIEQIIIDAVKKAKQDNK